MKIKFLRKAPMKTAGEKALNFGIKTGATVGAAYVCNLEKVQASKVSKWIGPGLLALELAAEIFVEQEQVLAATRGAGSYGALATTGEFVIKDKAKLGLSGASYESDIEKTKGGEKTVGALDWEKLAKEAIEEVPEVKTPVAGAEDEEPVAGPLSKRKTVIRMDAASKLMAA
ncbi:MAG: hypothetical protein AB7G44_07085 [Bacteroidia bacterium]